MRIVPVAALSLVLALTPAAAAGDKLPPDRPPSSMTSSEIKAYNAGLDDNHPYYIRCRKTEVIGSLVKKLRVCRTNQEWTKAADLGNQEVRDTIDAMNKGGTNNN